MGRLIAVLAVAGAAAFAVHPGASLRARSSSPAAARASEVASRDSRAAAALERDFARRQEEVGLSGSAPLFGAEGLPKPVK
jgi:hypothetical protein